ncbi:MAG: hypothetical protein K2X27_13455 [Candidatus Obscuribacterales bacterium]|nr:hypothetical protein [Candidatus Obscuribacterales bacterium]
MDQVISQQKEDAANADIDKLAANMLRDRMDAAPLQRSVNEKFRDELSLCAGLPTNVCKQAIQHIQENPGKITETVLLGAVMGAGIACAVKNPAILGKGLSTGVMEVAEKSAPVFASMAALDWGCRLGAPALKVWQNDGQLNLARQDLARNIGSGLVDYSAGALGAIVGARAAWKLAPEWVNKSPAFDSRPSLALGEKPRVYDGSEAALKTVKETGIADDVANLYEKSFPIEERQPLPEVAELVESGRIVVHTTRDAEGKLQGFSFTSMHDETATKFANLDFIATAEEMRSKGIGSIHLRRLRDLVGKENPELSALTLEMEHPKEAGLDDMVRAEREFRSKYYDRLDTPDTNIKFTILDFEDPSYRGPAQWRAWVYKPEKFDAVKTARTMYMDEGGYGLPKNSIQIKEFDRANNYWEAPFGPNRSAAYAAVLGGNSLTQGLLKRLDSGK